MLATLPLTLSGWQREQQVLRVPLFKRLRERADVPFAIFRTSLQVVCLDCTMACANWVAALTIVAGVAGGWLVLERAVRSEVEHLKLNQLRNIPDSCAVP